MLSAAFLLAAILAAYLHWKRQKAEQANTSTDYSAGMTADNPLFQPLVGASNPLYSDEPKTA